MESQQSDTEGEWKTFSSKKKSYDNKKKPRNIAPKKKIVKCWYDNNSWQHNVLTDQFIYEDGTTVLNKYNISELKLKYENSKSNYEKNNCFKELMKVINEQTWKTEKLTFEKEEVNKEEVVEEVKVEEEVKKEVIDFSKSLVRENVSFASLFKN